MENGSSHSANLVWRGVSYTVRILCVEWASIRRESRMVMGSSVVGSFTQRVPCVDVGT